MFDILEDQLRAALANIGGFQTTDTIVHRSRWEEISNELAEDLMNFAAKDPASHKDPIFILETYTSFRAVLHYRLAHAVLTSSFIDQPAGRAKKIAGLISAKGKISSGADIHPAAKIGRRFVLDHGYGTVVGETAEIGDDCYMLGSVTLGARGIGLNSNERRHPIIGDRVQIGAFARIFGRVHIGDDVFLGPHCVITQDVPSQTSIVVRSSHQVSRNSSSRLKFGKTDQTSVSQ